MDRRILAIPLVLMATVLLLAISIAFSVALILDDLHDFVPGTDQFQWLPGSPFSFFINGIHIHHLYVGVALLALSIVALLLVYWHHLGEI